MTSHVIMHIGLSRSAIYGRIADLLQRANVAVHGTLG